MSYAVLSWSHENHALLPLNLAKMPTMGEVDELRREIAELRADLLEISAGYAMGNGVLASMLIAFLDERGIVSAEELQKRIRIELGPIERAELPRHAVTAMLLQLHDLLDRKAFERWKPTGAANSDDRQPDQ